MRLEPIGQVQTQQVLNRQRVQQPQFKGLFPTKIIGGSRQQLFTNDISAFLQINRKTAKKYYSSKHNERTFTYWMAQKTRESAATNNYIVDSETLSKFDDVLKSTKKITPAHLSLAYHSAYNLDDVHSILTTANTDKTKLDLLNKLTELKLPSDTKAHLSAKNIISVINSEYSGIINNNFDKYKSFMALNSQEDFISKLEDGIKNSTLDTKHFDNKFHISAIRTKIPNLEVIPDDVLINNHNKYGDSLFKVHSFEIFPRKRDLEPSEIEILTNIYKTTTADNLLNRRAFFKKSGGVLNNNNSYENIQNFFAKLDNEPDFKKFYQKILSINDSLSSLSAKKLAYYADVFGSDILTKNIDNFNSILVRHWEKPEEEIVSKLQQHLRDDYHYDAIDRRIERHREKMNRGRTDVSISDKVSDFIYKTKVNIMTKLFNMDKETPIKNNMSFKYYEVKPTLQESLDAHSISQKKNAEELSQNSNKIETSQPILPEDPLTFESISSTPSQPLNEEWTPDFEPVKLIKLKTPPKGTRIKIRQEVTDILKSKMKSKAQFDDQIRTYQNKSSKLRNSFLLNMFNSVKETRAQDRKNNIKPQVSNEDILELYKRITGKNKKIVSYLLNKRKDDGTLEFNIREISNILDDIHAKRPPEMRSKNYAK
jgi:hypothetical protein